MSLHFSMAQACLPALHMAAWRGRASVVRSLLAGGRRDPDEAFGSAGTPLFLAAKSGSVASVRVLLAAGADPLRRASPAGQMPAEAARALGHERAAVVLEEAAAAAPRPSRARRPGGA